MANRHSAQPDKAHNKKHREHHPAKHWLHRLFELTQAVDAYAAGQENLDAVSGFVLTLLNAKRCQIVVLSPTDGDLYIEAAAGLTTVQKEKGRYCFGEGVVGHVIQTGTPMFIPDTAKDPLFLNRTQARKKEESAAFLCVPIKAEGRTVGALSVDEDVDRRRPFDEDMTLLGIVAAILAPMTEQRRKGIEAEEEEKAERKQPKRRRPPDIIGNSHAIQAVIESIEHVADASTTVLLRGESGTGKEVVARALHAGSPRKTGPFIALNCAVLPESLIESELFGHEKGAFTGAAGMRKGRFELADGGTLFLDEVGELALPMQARLLRVLQERTFERLGGSETRSVDVRIITATNRPLEDMVAEGTFRRDLYYRISVYPIFLPPLRERRSDIMLLANYFLAKSAAVNHRAVPQISLAAMDMMHRYDWPGNIRELENFMERAILLVGKGTHLLPQHLPPEMHSPTCPVCNAGHARKGGEKIAATGSLPERLEELERTSIAEALTRYRGQVGAAAEALGMTERVMGMRMRKYNLDYKIFRHMSSRRV